MLLFVKLHQNHFIELTHYLIFDILNQIYISRQFFFKMKYAFAFFVSFLVTQISFAQHAKECFVYEHAYKFGKPIKDGVLAEHHLFDKDGLLKTKKLFSGIGNRRDYFEYQYDSLKRCTIEKEYTKNGRLLSENQFEYNELGKLAAEKKYDSKGTFISKTSYVFTGDLPFHAEMSVYNTAGLHRKTLTTKIENDRLRTEAIVYYPNGSVEFLVKISDHDAFGNECKKTFYDSKGNYLYAYTRQWDANNRLIFKYLENQYKITYTYNSKKLLETEIHYNPVTGEAQKLVRYVYFD